MRHSSSLQEVSNNGVVNYIAANIAFHLDGVEPGSLVSPWESVDKDAPELEEPVNFAEFHRFMTMSSAEVEQNNLRLIPAVFSFLILILIPHTLILI